MDAALGPRSREQRRRSGAARCCCAAAAAEAPPPCRRPRAPTPIGRGAAPCHWRCAHCPSRLSQLLVPRAWSSHRACCGWPHLHKPQRRPASAPRRAADGRRSDAAGRSHTPKPRRFRRALVGDFAGAGAGAARKCSALALRPPRVPRAPQATPPEPQRQHRDARRMHPQELGAAPSRRSSSLCYGRLCLCAATHALPRVSARPPCCICGAQSRTPVSETATARTDGPSENIYTSPRSLARL
jgi:hypothetical protein